MDADKFLIAAAGAVGGVLLKYFFDRRAAVVSEISAQKRQLYAEMVVALGVFLDRSDTAALRERFLESYAKIWLWASDDVVREINKLLELNRKSLAGDRTAAVAQHAQFQECMIAMRRDLRRSSLSAQDYEIVDFVELRQPQRDTI